MREITKERRKEIILRNIRDSISWLMGLYAPHLDPFFRVFLLYEHRKSPVTRSAGCKATHSLCFSKPLDGILGESHLLWRNVVGPSRTTRIPKKPRSDSQVCLQSSPDTQTLLLLTKCLSMYEHLEKEQNLFPTRCIDQQTGVRYVMRCSGPSTFGALDDCD